MGAAPWIGLPGCCPNSVCLNGPGMMLVYKEVAILRVLPHY